MYLKTMDAVNVCMQLCISSVSIFARKCQHEKRKKNLILFFACLIDDLSPTPTQCTEAGTLISPLPSSSTPLLNHTFQTQLLVPTAGMNDGKAIINFFVR